MSSSAETTLRARLGAHTLHSRYDSRELTAPARAAFMASFAAAVDPDGMLPEAERARRADHAKRAHFTRMALLSARARSNQGKAPGAGTPEAAAEVRRGSAAISV